MYRKHVVQHVLQDRSKSTGLHCTGEADALKMSFVGGRLLGTSREFPNLLEWLFTTDRSQKRILAKYRRL